MTDPSPQPQSAPHAPNQPVVPPVEQTLGAEFIPFGPVQTQVHDAVLGADGSTYVPFTVKIPGVAFSFALDVDHARRFSANIAQRAVGSTGRRGGLQIAHSLPPEPPRRG